MESDELASKASHHNSSDELLQEIELEPRRLAEHLRVPRRVPGDLDLGVGASWEFDS